MNVRDHNAALRGLRALALCTLCVVSGGMEKSHAEDIALWLPRYATYFEDALAHLNMTTQDPGFKKDYVDARCVLSVATNILNRPLLLCEEGSAVVMATQLDGPEGLLPLVRRWLDADPVDGAMVPPTVRGLPDGLVNPPLSVELTSVLQRFYHRVSVAGAVFSMALNGLSREDRETLLTIYAYDLLDAESGLVPYPQQFAALGVSQEVLAAALQRKQSLDDSPYSEAFLDAAERLSHPVMLQAAGRFVEAVHTLLDEAGALSVWPDTVVTMDTPLGTVVVGTMGANTFDGPALLILDPGGDDLYRGSAGVANGLTGDSLAVVCDLGGDDVYRNDGLIGTGCGLFGMSCVVDLAGQDDWRLHAMGIGCGFGGVGWVEDRGGDDRYRSGLLSQAAGVLGLGVLYDCAGSDTYRVAAYGQGFAGVLGVGWLEDCGGNDAYYAGGLLPDFERHGQHHLSLAQGFAIGMRPTAGGGVAVLMDRSGNDTYQSEVYGQGVSYWYSVGMLLDLAGQDTYSVYEYGQGTGIHLSSGLIFDGEGHDRYSGQSLSQGSAHDFSVGVLIDADGDDTYTADHYSQGRGINNSFALLCDAQGDDGFFARQNDECQGVGHHNTDRGYGSLSVLMDLGGKDQYSSGARNDDRVQRPDFGIVYDVEADGEEE